MKALTTLLGIKQSLSTAYHPQTDGQTERMNREIETYLRIFTANNPSEWSKHLVTAEFSHNRWVHETLKMSPFQVIMGYEPTAIPLAAERSDVPAVAKRLQEIQAMRSEAQAAHELTRHRMASQKEAHFTPFQKGQKVWLEATNLHTPSRPAKFTPKREGPFTVKNRLSDLVYELDLPTRWKIHPIFHVSLLKEAPTSKWHDTPEPTSILIDKEEEWEVQEILDIRRRRRRWNFHTVVIIIIIINLNGIRRS